MNATGTQPRVSRRHIITRLDDIRRAREEIREHWIAAMREARENGFTNQQIGDVLGVSETAVRNALKRAGGN
ncbi:sigma factor-like helix-turn-helix DNA-binding protein [Prescottella equi]|nr:hypothetical protein [Prescottella equi]MBM4657395.1 hypothetical protein [Prescottella equi]MBM4720227.1 hypothetical protein [Prescottella equi]MBM4720293.1 hypothetical protein [Prescottella equi]NKR22088.1 hypothetical protein [Prescottella equi]